MSQDREIRLRRLEDRAAITEVVVTYGVAVDRRDWALFADCFTDPVDTDYSALGGPAKQWPRDAFVELEDSPDGDFYLARGAYENHMLRTSEGWRIARIVQDVFWQDGNTNAVAESRERFLHQQP